MVRDKPRVAVFVHVPKTGGVSVIKIVERKFRSHEICWLKGLDAVASLEEFAGLPETVRAAYRFIRGHIPYGIDEHVPGPCGYFTMLRDPVERIVSGYFDIFRRPKHFLHHSIAKPEIALEGFLNSEVTTGIDNGQTRLLCGDTDALDVVTRGDDPADVRIELARIGFGECTREMLDRAKSNLEQRVAVVGLTERFDESMVLFRREFGWSLPYGRKKNVGTNRPARKTVAPDTYRRIESENALDRELYDFAAQLFEERLAAEGGAARRDLRMVRAANTFAGGDDPLARGLRFLRRRALRL